MSIDKPEETKSQVSEVTKASVRRDFLKKSAIGIVVTSLPAQSVWGTSNGSAVSGGSGSTVTYELPHCRGGRSPGSWSKFTEVSSRSSGGGGRGVRRGSFSSSDWEDPSIKVGRNKVRSMFSTYSSSRDDILEEKVFDLKAYIESTVIVLSDGGGNVPRAVLDLGQALSNPGGIWNLAAFYLNAKFGFYDIPPEFRDADELIQHVWAVLYFSNGKSYPTNFDRLTSSFTDGVSHHTIPSYGGRR